jgi:hypothetical protein
MHGTIIRSLLDTILPKPTRDYVSRRIDEFDGDARYYGADRAMALVFTTWPGNAAYEHILVKVILLNRLYSTNICDPYTVANHVEKLSIDRRLASGDSTLIDDLADVKFGKTTRTIYSFATKYCAWHQPDHYQVYDGYVDWLLWEYRRLFGFAQFKRYELRQYQDYLRIAQQFVAGFRLDGFTRKQIDRFLWIEGKRAAGQP